jgi:hypothetical protein
MSKGSRRRPYSVPIAQVNSTHETIFGVKPPKEQYVPPPLPTEEVEEKKAIWISGDNNVTKN